MESGNDLLFHDDDEEEEEEEEEPPSSMVKETRDTIETEGAQTRPAVNGCFDCNICLDHAAEPVVTLCGHLYCWPCLYKWLRRDGSAPQPCPVCKAPLSQATLVPLYGRGYESRPADNAPGVPRRPSLTMAVPGSSGSALASQLAHSQQQQHRRRHPYPGRDDDYTMSSSSSSMTAARVLHPAMPGGVAIAVLPWVLGDEGMGPYYPDPYPAVGGDTAAARRMRRQEMQARRSLHRISLFLLCCVVLCLLVF